MKSYFKERATEWSTWLGAIVTILGIAIPHFVPLTMWAAYLQDALIVIGVLMGALPQTAGTETVEKEIWALLRALSTVLPKEYVPALQPIISQLGTMAAKDTNPPVAVPAVTAPETPTANS